MASRDYSATFLSGQISDWVAFSLALSASDLASRAARQEAVIGILLVIFWLQGSIEWLARGFFERHRARPSSYSFSGIAADFLTTTRRVLCVTIPRLSMSVLQARLGLHSDPFGTALFAYVVIVSTVAIARIFAPEAEAAAARK